MPNQETRKNLFAMKIQEAIPCLLNTLEKFIAVNVLFPDAMEAFFWRECINRVNRVFGKNGGGDRKKKKKGKEKKGEIVPFPGK